MDKLLEQLGSLFLNSLPSVFLLILLFFYLKAIVFGPLEKVLASRYQKTEGKEKDAGEMLRLAEQKAEEYARALQSAKAEIYAQQELLRKNLEAERDAAIAEASERNAILVQQGRAAVDRDYNESREIVRSQAASLAQLVADKVLFRGAA